jgi:hypothetical protein
VNDDVVETLLEFIDDGDNTFINILLILGEADKDKLFTLDKVFEGVLLIVFDSDTLEIGEGEIVICKDGLFVALFVSDIVGLNVYRADDVNVLVAVSVAVELAVADAVPVAVSVAVELAVADAVPVDVELDVAVLVDVELDVDVLVDVELDVAVLVDVELAVADPVPVDVELDDAVAVAVDVLVSVDFIVNIVVGLILIDVVSVTIGLIVIYAPL